MKRFSLTLLSLLLIGSVAMAQSDSTKRQLSYPDLPGHLIVDFGFNFWNGGADTLSSNLWGSKSVGLYYIGNYRIGQTPFSFSPGLGLSMEKYAFDNDVNLVPGTDGAEIAFLQTTYPGATIDKTKLAATYLEAPLELRFHANRRNPDRGFKVAVGFKAGLLMSTHSKVVGDNGDAFTAKYKNDFSLNTFRGSAIGRIGFSGVNLFFEKSLTELFKSGEAPEDLNITPFKIGFSFTGF